ncbi:MAG: OadG family protein [Clostridia bacterium]|nr:OadG family protein [Clostridia bacterium]
MNSLITAVVDTSALLSEAGMTVLIGFCVVFAALLLLTVVFWAFGAVARGKEKEPTPQLVSTPTQPPKTAPVVEDGISDEVVAVIAAAVAAMSDGGKQYAVRRIVSSRTTARPVWAAAGIAENTQPF